MPKLKKDDIVVREAFLRELFTQNPGLSAAKANEALKAKFASQMRVSRVYQLQREVSGKEVRARMPGTGKPGRPPGRPAKAPTTMHSVHSVTMLPGASNSLPQLVRFASGEAHTDVLERTLRQLREAGLTNLGVGHKADGYVVIDLAQPRAATG
jgi:hypothetical protein